MGYDNTNSGTLFRNDKRETEKHPTHTGSIDIEGKQYWISAWIMEVKKDSSPRKGEKFFSLKVTEKDSANSGPSSPMTSDGIDIDDDIPF